MGYLLYMHIMPIFLYYKGEEFIIKQQFWKDYIQDIRLCGLDLKDQVSYNKAFILKMLTRNLRTFRGNAEIMQKACSCMSLSYARDRI